MSKKMQAGLSVRTEGNATIWRLYETNVARIEPGRITLKTGGYVTQSTAKAIRTATGRYTSYAKGCISLVILPGHEVRFKNRANIIFSNPENTQIERIELEEDAWKGEVPSSELNHPTAILVARLTGLNGKGERVPACVSGYWDGGSKCSFEYKVERIFRDGQARVGSWDANYYQEHPWQGDDASTLRSFSRSPYFAKKIQGTLPAYGYGKNEQLSDCRWEFEIKEVK